MQVNSIALSCVGSLGLLLFGLGLAVSALRFRERTGAGLSPDPADLLHKVARAHANTAEFAPFLAVLFLYLGAQDPSPAMLWLMVGATVCRFLLVIGLVAWPTMARPNPVRFVGALGTYIFGAVLSVAVLVG